MLNSIALFYTDGILNNERLGLLIHQVPYTVGLSDNSEDLKKMSADYKKKIKSICKNIMRLAFTMFYCNMLFH